MKYGLLFLVPGLAYVVVVINLRALNRMKYGITAATDFVYALLNFWVIEHVAGAKSPLEAVIYAAGATSGSICAMWLTRHWK